MKELKDKIENWDPLNLNQEPQLTKYRPKFMLISVVACVAIISSILMFIFLGIVSDRNSKLSHYKSQIKSWNKLDESAKFSNIRFGMKIMPSENTRLNNIDMKWSNDTKLLHNSKIERKYSFNESFHMFEETTQYFPTLHFEEGEVPFGDSDYYCLYISWINKEQEGLNDLYDPVKNLPCLLYTSDAADE